jgi:hypothetical protein
MMDKSKCEHILHVRCGRMILQSNILLCGMFRMQDNDTATPILSLHLRETCYNSKAFTRPTCPFREMLYSMSADQ